MACKHLEMKDYIKPVEIGDAAVMNSYKRPTCKINRQPGIIGWATRCKQTDNDGPCWWWSENFPDMLDTEF